MDKSPYLEAEISLSGQIALVTAGASGLGRGIAYELAKCGATVWVWDRDEKALLDCKQDFSAHGLSIHTASFNLVSANEMSSAFAELIARSGRLDILVNNAGGSLHTPFRFLEETDDDWARVFELNLMATVRLTRLVLPIMTGNRYGRVVNLGSKAGRYGSLFAGANYASVKGAIHALTLQLAQEFGPHGVTVNAICPGAIMTPRVKGLLEERQSLEERTRVLNGIPVRRHGEVSDVARTVRFLVSKEAGFITGSLIDINGGQAMST
jgi:NAD(P)-dependent dehydrogenase (short-subunit alcohol dehydrogenase family)